MEFVNLYNILCQDKAEKYTKLIIVALSDKPFVLLSFQILINQLNDKKVHTDQGTTDTNSDYTTWPVLRSSQTSSMECAIHMS